MSRIRNFHWSQFENLCSRRCVWQSKYLNETHIITKLGLLNHKRPKSEQCQDHFIYNQRSQFYNRLSFSFTSMQINAQIFVPKMFRHIFTWWQMSWRSSSPSPEFRLSRWPEQEEAIKQQSIIGAAESPHVCFKTTSDQHSLSDMGGWSH